MPRLHLPLPVVGRHFLVRVASAVLLASGAVAAGAAPVEMGGARFEDGVQVAGTRLELNGGGIRYKAVFKVYTAALYLTKKAESIEDVIAAPGPKRMQIAMLREIDSAELGKLFTRGVQDNLPRSEMSALVPGLIRMGQIFADQKKLGAGDVFTIDWIPGTGTVITVRGQPQGEAFKEPAFFNAMMRIWLGSVPADPRLKDQLLNKPT